MSGQDIKVTIGKNIAAARNALGWTQADLAKRSGQLSRGVIGKIESFNAPNISSVTLSIIAGTLGIPAYMLMLRELDWKNLAKIATSASHIEKHLRSGGSFSSEEVEQIEAMSKSDLKHEKRTAVIKTNAVVASILGLGTGGAQASLPANIERSRTAGTGMATAAIPNIPIFNGLIATMIST